MFRSKKVKVDRGDARPLTTVNRVQRFSSVNVLRSGGTKDRKTGERVRGEGGGLCRRYYCLTTKRNTYKAGGSFTGCVTRSSVRDNALCDCNFTTARFYYYFEARESTRRAVLRRTDTVGVAVNQVREGSIEYVDPR